MKIKGLFNTTLQIHWLTFAYVFFCFSSSAYFGWMMICALTCVTLHEFGHVYVAQKLNIKTGDIVIFPFGGVAALDLSSFRNAYSSFTEFAITIAGPMVNAVLALFFLPLAAITENKILLTIASVNVALFVFNFLPLFPMDGGRMLRALLYCFVGDFKKSTLYAVRFGQVVAFFVLLGSIYFGQYMLSVIVVMMAMAGETELRSVEVRAT